MHHQRPHRSAHLWNSQRIKSLQTRRQLCQHAIELVFRSRTLVFYAQIANLMCRAVITGANSRYHSIANLEGTPIGISRIGSGSQTMAYVMALQQGWPTDKLQFEGVYAPHFKL